MKLARKNRVLGFVVGFLGKEKNANTDNSLAQSIQSCKVKKCTQRFSSKNLKPSKYHHDASECLLLHGIPCVPGWLGPGDKHHLPSLGVLVGVSGCSIPWEVSIWGTQLIKRVLGERYPASVSKNQSTAEAGGASGDHLVQPTLRAGSAAVGCSEPRPFVF